MPGLVVIRPCDGNETAVAWQAALERRDGPTALVLTRQNLHVIDRTKMASAESLLKGGYVLQDAPSGRPDVILMATGSEVALIVAAGDLLAGKGIKARLVSMPSWELFRRQPEDYRQAVLPPDVEARLAVEAGVSFGWREWIGEKGSLVCLDHFGASAPGGTLFKEFGFTPENVTAAALDMLKKAVGKS
jgi:transketolase